MCFGQRQRDAYVYSWQCLLVRVVAGVVVVAPHRTEDALVFVEYEVTYRIHYRLEYGLCMWRLKSRQAGRQAGKLAESKLAGGQTDRRTNANERKNGRVGDYIDCVAGWQRQWHMSPRLLVIADLNMRQRGPCRVVCAAPASYFCLRLHTSLAPANYYYYYRVHSFLFFFPLYLSPHLSPGQPISCPIPTEVQSNDPFNDHATETLYRE